MDIYKDKPSDVKALVLVSNLIWLLTIDRLLTGLNYFKNIGQAMLLYYKHDTVYIFKAYMGVPRKMSESHWGTYFIWPFRWRGFLGGSRMSSNIVSLHLPKYEIEEWLSQAKSLLSSQNIIFFFKHDDLTLVLVKQN